MTRSRAGDRDAGGRGALRCVPVRRLPIRRGAAGAAQAMLAACGGGGGGGTDGGNTGGGNTGGGTTPGGSVIPADPPVRVSSTSPFGQFCDGTLQTVGVTYYDFRSNTADPRTLPTDYWLARSADGINWRESRVAAAFDLAIAPNANGLFLGDYQGLGTIGNVFVPFFAQTGGGDVANPTDVWSVVSRNGSVATEVEALRQSLVQRVGDDNLSRSYRAGPMLDAIDDPALRRAVHESIVRTMEARVPGWSARTAPAAMPLPAR